jgi:hypothetical protein
MIGAPAAPQGQEDYSLESPPTFPATTCFHSKLREARRDKRLSSTRLDPIQTFYYQSGLSSTGLPSLRLTSDDIADFSSSVSPMATPESPQATTGERSLQQKFFRYFQHEITGL